MKKPRLLLVTPDHDFKRLLSFLGSKLGVESFGVASVPEAWIKAESLLPELIVLDEGGHQGEALALVRRLRGIAPFLDTPIFLLVDHPQRKYEAFQAGATDVMLKPLDALEFQYRLQVHLRSRMRRLETAPAVKAGLLTLHPATHEITLHGLTIQFTPSEFSILSYLTARPSRAVSTADLLVGALGEPPLLGNPQVVHTHIRNLRRKLEALSMQPSMITSSRRGYTFQAP